MRLEIGIIALLEEVIGIPAEKRAQFDWLCNKPSRKHFGEYYDVLMELYRHLQGDWEGTTKKSHGHLTPDAYFPEPYNFIFEFDELQHFTKYRKSTFKFYPENIPIAYETEVYIEYCRHHNVAALAKGADRYRRPTADFPYINGRAAQRAFFDTCRDWLPTLHGLNPTLRLAEFEVTVILNRTLTGNDAKDFMETLIRKKLTIPKQGHQ